MARKIINILGHDYKVTKVPQKRLGEGVIGLCIFESKQILLLNSLTGELLYRTLLHELRHAFQYESGFTQLLHPQSQEIDCEQFASFIVSLKRQRIV